MGNSTSSGLGSGSTHGSRDVRTTDPETEVERPSASPEPNRTSQIQLPVPPKPNIGARTWGLEVRQPEVGQKVRQQVRDPNSRINANSNIVVREPVYEEVQVPTCSSSTSIQRRAWKSENSLFDRTSPQANSPEVRPAVRPTAPEAVRPRTTEVPPELREDRRRRSAELHPEVRRRSDGEVRPAELEQDHVTEQAVRKVRPGDAHTNSPEVRLSRTYPNCANGFAPTTEDSREQALWEVRPDDVSHSSLYSFGVRPGRPDRIPDDVSHSSLYYYGVRPGRPEHIHANQPDDLYPALDDSQVQSIVRGVRPEDVSHSSHYSYGVRPGRPDHIPDDVSHSSHYSYGVRPGRPEHIHTNYANRPAHAESNEFLPSRIYRSQKTNQRKINSSLGRTACSCSEPRRTDSHAVGPDTRIVHPGRIRLPHCTKNFELPQGTTSVEFQYKGCSRNR